MHLAARGLYAVAMDDLTEFGRFLKQHREGRGLSRDDLARITRISPGVIVALEEGQTERLPAQVFVQNYVRSYARAVGLVEQEVLNRLLAVPGVLPPTEQSPALLESSRRTHAYGSLAILVVVLLLGAVALWWWKAST